MLLFFFFVNYLIVSKYRNGGEREEIRKAELLKLRNLLMSRHTIVPVAKGKVKRTYGKLRVCDT